MSESMEVVLERHDQHIKSLQHQVNDIRVVQSEIREMNKALITLTTELKHTNEHLERQERKIEVIESQPKNRLNQIITAIISAIAGGLIAVFIEAIIP